MRWAVKLCLGRINRHGVTHAARYSGSGLPYGALGSRTRRCETADQGGTLRAFGAPLEAWLKSAGEFVQEAACFRERMFVDHQVPPDTLEGEVFQVFIERREGGIWRQFR